MYYIYILCSQYTILINQFIYLFKYDYFVLLEKKRTKTSSIMSYVAHTRSQMTQRHDLYPLRLDFALDMALPEIGRQTAVHVS